MIKTISQGLITIALFLLTWFLLLQVSWVDVFKVKKITDNTDEKIGNLIWETIQKGETKIQDPFVVKTIDSIVSKICISNQLDKDFIKVHIIEKDEINAFALPNGHLVVYSELILSSQNQEELSGVICHEIAHIQLGHVMKKLVKEIGLSVLISMTAGSSTAAETIKEAASLLSSSAFDRSMEQEADIKAVDYLLASKIDPKPLANFLYMLAEEEGSTGEYLAWISTHPESKERAEYIIEYCKSKETTYEPVISAATWATLKEKLTKQHN